MLNLNPGSHSHACPSRDLQASAADISQHGPTHDHIHDSSGTCDVCVHSLLSQLRAADRD